VTFDAGSYGYGGTTLPRVDAIAAKAQGGTLWLALTNVDPNRSVQIEVTAPGVRRATGETLTSPRIDSINTFESPTTIAPKPIAVKSAGGKVILKLVPHSVTVVALEG